MNSSRDYSTRRAAGTAHELRRVSSLDRIWRRSVHGRAPGSVQWALTLTAGAEYEPPRRREVINNLGVQGALKREKTTGRQPGRLRAGGVWFVPTCSVSAGVRYTKVDFTSEDRYITTGKSNDSGSTSYGEWTPTVRLLYSVTPDSTLYASYGRAFETPTTANFLPPTGAAD